VIVVVDASALVAVGLREPERAAIVEALADADSLFMTPVNILEAGLVLVLRQALYDLAGYRDWLEELRVTELDVSGREALAAYLQYGRGVHRAGLNLGDCFAYALAKRLDAALLFKGNDFVLTDARPALQPT
jgi:ribonuclease VapC